MTITDILNRFRWDKTYDFRSINIWYVSRGDLDNIASVNGSDILKIGAKFLETKKGPIPLHRIVKIVYKDDEIFKR